MSSLQQVIQKLIDDAAHEFRVGLRDATVQIQEEPREWEAFGGRITRRKNPAAPMPVVEEYRDNIDSGDARDNTIVDGIDIKINVPYAAELYEDKPLFEEMLSETDLQEVWREALVRAVEAF